jgi:hypothetical protein
MNTPTPETEHHLSVDGKYGRVSPDFSRKLERERNEARASYLGLQQEHIKIVAELDQLRKISETLAKELFEALNGSSSMLIGLRNYNQHVKERDK